MIKEVRLTGLQPTKPLAPRPTGRMPMDKVQLLNLALQPDWFDWLRYLNLLNYRERTKLEKAMLIYCMHVNYIRLVMDVSLEKLINHREWHKKWLPFLWNSAIKKVKLTKTNFDDLQGYKDTVHTELFGFYHKSFYPLLNLIKKGNYK